MESGDPSMLPYQRARFVTRLPLDRRYSPSHFWLRPLAGTWRVGLTTFATRILGQIVDYGFELRPGDAVRSGQVIGWIEGFKSISDMASVIDGTFTGLNARLSIDPEVIDRDCYGDGWLYEATGQPEPTCLDVHGYKALLDATIDRLIAQQPPRAEP